MDAGSLAMLLDGFPPSPFSRDERAVGGVSVGDTVHIHRLPDVAADAWLPALFESRDAADALALEHGRIAAPDGSVIAESFHTRLLALTGATDIGATLR